MSGVTSARLDSDGVNTTLTVEVVRTDLRVSQPLVSDVPNDLRAALFAWLDPADRGCDVRVDRAEGSFTCNLPRRHGGHHLYRSSGDGGLAEFDEHGWFNWIRHGERS